MNLRDVVATGLIADASEKLAKEYYSYSGAFLEAQTEQGWKELFERSLRKIVFTDLNQ